MAGATWDARRPTDTQTDAIAFGQFRCSRIWSARACTCLFDYAKCESMPVLSFPGSLPSHDRDIAIGLVGYHLPASRKAGQNRRLSPAFSQQHEAMTFLGLNPATTCFFDFPSGIKKSQRIPARYTRSRTTKLRSRRQWRRSIAPATIAGLLAGLIARILAWHTPPSMAGTHHALSSDEMPEVQTNQTNQLFKRLSVQYYTRNQIAGDLPILRQRPQDFGVDSVMEA